MVAHRVLSRVQLQLLYYIIYYVQYIYRAYEKKLFSDFAFMGEAAFLLCCGV